MGSISECLAVPGLVLRQSRCRTAAAWRGPIARGADCFPASPQLPSPPTHPFAGHPSSCALPLQAALEATAEGLKLENSALIQQFDRLKLRFEAESAAFQEQVGAAAWEPCPWVVCLDGWKTGPCAATADGETTAG